MRRIQRKIPRTVILLSACLKDYHSKRCAAQLFVLGHWVQGSAPAAHRAGDLIAMPGFQAVRKNETG
jgi:hypothetical protein